MSGGDSDRLTGQLVDIGDGLAHAFVTLSNAPTLPSCEELAIRLQGAARHVMQLHAALREQGQADGP